MSQPQKSRKYVPPNKIVSPKKHWSMIAVLEDEGQGREKHALCVGRWDGTAVLGLRWNGDDDNVGAPQSRGIGIWFVVPDAYVDGIISCLKPDKVSLVRNFIPKNRK
jgi:hypothetical protein